MKKIAIKLNLTPERIRVYFNLALIFFVIILLFLLATFLYQDFYKTITQSEEVIILQGKATIESVDMNKFNLVIEKIKEKAVLREINPLKNPFN